MRITTLTLTTALVLTSAACYAQSATGSTSTSTVTTAGINAREENQQDRIAQGIASGQLTASEASTLETQESGIKQEERGMREQDNGKLTTQDKATLNSQLNTESKDIYADKHNASVQPPDKGEINGRLENQQDRIGAGMDKGELNAGQVAKLEHQVSGIQTEESGMRSQDNGKLTAQDRKLLNKQLNQESRRINRDERKTLKH